MNGQRTIMKKIHLSMLLAASLSALAIAYSFHSKNNTVMLQEKSAAAGFAVVELFTSEGCSSCPPADEAIAKLLDQHMANVYILSFHVDYWNKLGWKDPFSQALFSERQREYAQALSLQRIYTPQVVVNGRTEFVGSDTKKLQAAVETGLRGEANPALDITVKRAGNTLDVTYNTTEKNGLINLALVEPEATTVVKRGENGGRTLHHVNIVRSFRTAEASATGHLSLQIPEELAHMPLQLIAYTQSNKSLKITSAVKKALP